ncbi:MAG TPA: acyl-CoA dehydrogenase family protein [Acidimicrobiales bacterium]|nr:acyl-CoA dehydrogenase family protein [Acidimicrobiales bacterium]
MATTIDSGATTAPANAAATLAAVRDLAPEISARGPEIEQARRLPADLLDQLIDAGCFRLVLPASHGGAGATLTETMQVLETLSRADASVGWAVMIGAGSWCDLAGLPREMFDALFGGGDVITAGAFAPSGTATPVDGGYRISGRWAFVSGCEYATWVFGNSIEQPGPGGSAGPDGSGDGPPRMRVAVFSPDEIEIEDTWDVSGLRGTGSHHVRADDVFVPAARTLAMLEDEPCIDEPLLRIPVPTLYSLPVASVALGIARGAIDDILDLAAHKVPLLDQAPLAGSVPFQVDLAVADTRLRAAAALVYDVADELWTTAVEASPVSPEQRARARAAAVWATSQAVEAVTSAYRAGGGSSLYADSPLQRRLRDINAVTQHFLVKPATLATAGAVLAGQDVDLTVF